MKIKSKQRNSRMCIICGMDNPNGVKAEFYNMEDNSVVSLFQYRETHQSYPGRVHGGMITAMLDEIGLRAVWTTEENQFGVTMSLKTNYRKPVPYNTPLFARGEITLSNHRFLKAEAKIYDSDGNLLADGEMKYIKLKDEEISKTPMHEDMIYLIESDLTEIKYPWE